MAVELARFEIGPAAETEMLAAHLDAVRSIRGACPGLIEARLFRGEEPGTWIDVWFWASLDAARAAAETAMTLPAASRFFSFIAAAPTMIHGTLVAEDLGA
ncbi:MAG: antibiotic biosynthesis monooxygenase [Acidimicrobiales bacterium]|nr:antibiotic biosynthesis monooxygenase [Acidimicrobiales bacterium]